LAISNPLIIFSMFFKSLADAGPLPAVPVLLTVDETDDGVGDGDR
jgi:hypothetical protein